MKELFPFYTIGHFINRPAVRTDFEVMRFEEMEEPDVDEIHKHTFYEIIWIAQGNSKQTIDYKQYDIAPQSLFFISPNQVHQFEEWQPLLGGSIMFTQDFFLLNYPNQEKLFELSFLDNFYTNPCINLNDADFNDIMQTIGAILKEQARKDRKPDITQALLHILLAQIQRCVDTQTEKPVPKKYLVIYKRFKGLLDLHFQENKTASFFAGQLSITQHHLNLVTRNVTGKTISEVIRARSILEAKRMLTFTDQSVAEIAARLHYFDSSYFTKLFRKETGLAPLAFKKQMSEKYRIR